MVMWCLVALATVKAGGLLCCAVLCCALCSVLCALCSVLCAVLCAVCCLLRSVLVWSQQ